MAHTKESLSTWKLTELKQWLAAEKVPLGNKTLKADLIELVLATELRKCPQSLDEEQLTFTQFSVVKTQKTKKEAMKDDAPSEPAKQEPAKPVKKTKSSLALKQASTTTAAPSSAPPSPSHGVLEKK